MSFCRKLERRADRPIVAIHRQPYTLWDGAGGVVDRAGVAGTQCELAGVSGTAELSV
jgi:hypothetical protein